MGIWTLAKKDMRILLRDPRAVTILFAMPLIFILVLGVSLGEGFGQKPDDRLKVSVLVLDEGPPRFFDRPLIFREGMAFASTGSLDPISAIGMLASTRQVHDGWFPHEPWSERLLADLRDTASIRVEVIRTREEAEELIRSGRRAAVLVIGRHFSKRVSRCSFLSHGWRELFRDTTALPMGPDPIQLMMRAAHDEHQTAYPLYLGDGLNPFFRDGVKLDVLDVEVMRDPTQRTASAIIDQVAQGSLVRIVMPWMIGRAFEKVADPKFLTLLANEKQIPGMVRTFLDNPLVPESQRRQLGLGLKNALQNLFPKYNLTAKTWASLTKEAELEGRGPEAIQFQEDGTGWLRRGAMRYQLLVPSYLVMFAFFMVLTVGWMFVAERRQGTLRRLRLAPLSSLDILVGKLLPCLLLSLVQGILVLAAGRLFFGMSWGPHPIWVLAVVASTSMAAMGLAVLTAAIAKTETQVAIYGTLLVLVLAGLSGALMGDRSQLPDQMQTVSLATPHAWALDAYRQLLTTPRPAVERVAQACGALLAFGFGFLLVAWLSRRSLRTGC
ncbi:MAG: ABC transporter permease [Gemmataceae bacterium]